MKYSKYCLLGLLVFALSSCSSKQPVLDVIEESISRVESDSVENFIGYNFEVLPKEELISVQFSQHVDGDTTWFLINNQKVKVRYLLIDTPETVKVGVDPQPFGQEASDRTKQLLTEADRIEIMLDKGETLDAYGRLLAYIFVDDQLVQEILVSEGLASVAYVNEPNTKYLEQLESVQQKTMDLNPQIGIWSIPD